MMDGYAIMGAMVAEGPALVVRLRNVAALVEREKGKAGALAMTLAPETVTGKVYSTLGNKLRDAMAKEGADADVSIVTDVPRGPGLRRDLVTGVVTGLITAAIIWVIGKYALPPLRGLLGGQGAVPGSWAGRSNMIGIS